VPWTSACLCGCTYRERIDTAETLYRMPEHANLPQFDPFKDWRIKSLQVSWNIAELERAYRSDAPLDPEQVRRTVEMTLASCLDLADWLISGPEPHAVTAGEIERLLRADPLRVCVALHAHAAPDDSIGSVRLVPVAFAPTPRYWVHYTRPGAKPVRYDALDLAERCRAAWRDFLAGYGVVLPSWDS
jgi:hypothetical protein